MKYKSNQNPLSCQTKILFNPHTITPYLFIEKVPEQVEFLEEVFDVLLRGELKYREDGSVQHAEVIIGDFVIMVGTPMDEFKARKGSFYLYVDDCDQTYKKALKAGAESLMEPQNIPHGDRYGWRILMTVIEISFDGKVDKRKE